MVITSEKVNFIRKVFGSCVLSRDNINVSVRCPECAKDSGKKKLVIRIDDDRYHCWVCDIKGRNLSFLIRKVAPHLLSEYEKISRHAGRRENTDTEEELAEKIEIPKGFSLLVSCLNSREPDIRDTIRYIDRRGLSIRDMWYFRMGTCSFGRYRRRVILPSFDNEGNLNYYAARSIDTDIKMKYLNARVPKTEIIFNEMNIDWSEELTLVEGPFDLTKCDDNATCLLGSHLPERSKLFSQIIRYRTPIILALDSDAKKKSHDIARLLSSYDVNVRMIHLEGPEDVGAMSREQFVSAKKKALNWNTDDRLIDLINNIRSGSSL
jgi:DNA primase